MKGANIDTVEEELVDFGIELESYGGDVPVVPISAKSGENVDLLIELIEEDLKKINLKSDIKNQVELQVIESHSKALNNKKSASLIV